MSGDARTIGRGHDAAGLFDDERGGRNVVRSVRTDRAGAGGVKASLEYAMAGFDRVDDAELDVAKGRVTESSIGPPHAEASLTAGKRHYTPHRKSRGDEGAFVELEVMPGEIGHRELVGALVT